MTKRSLSLFVPALAALAAAAPAQAADLHEAAMTWTTTSGQTVACNMAVAANQPNGRQGGGLPNTVAPERPVNPNTIGYVARVLCTSPMNQTVQVKLRDGVFARDLELGPLVSGFFTRSSSYRETPAVLTRPVRIVGEFSFDLRSDQIPAGTPYWPAGGCTYNGTPARVSCQLVSPPIVIAPTPGPTPQPNA